MNQRVWTLSLEQALNPSLPKPVARQVSQSLVPYPDGLQIRKYDCTSTFDAGIPPYFGNTLSSRDFKRNSLQQLKST